MSKRANTGWLQTAYRLFVCCLVVLGTVASVGLAQDQVGPTQGQLRIEGTHIAHLVLRRDDDHTEEWSNLSGSIALPVGTYSIQQLSLRGDYTCQAQSLTALGQIEVSRDKPAVLKAGGPLRQKVEVRRHGRMLVLDYRLLGIGGEMYGPPPVPDRRGTFTVYRGDRAVANGAFEYG